MIDTKLQVYYEKLEITGSEKLYTFEKNSCFNIDREDLSFRSY